MLVKWKTDYSGKTIERVECTRETESTVWVLEDQTGWFDQQAGKPPKMVERRRQKDGTYHDTWELAHAYLLALATQNLEAARLNLARAQGHYGNLKGMKPPATHGEQS